MPAYTDVSGTSTTDGLHLRSRAHELYEPRETRGNHGGPPNDIFSVIGKHFSFDERAEVGKSRFAPKSYQQYISSVLTLWNLLDRNIEAHLGLAGTPFGYMRLVQLEAYSNLVLGKDQHITYCEIGFNGGHGTVAMLLANPKLVAHSFELGLNGPYSFSAASLLSTYFGSRFVFHEGSSWTTVPKFAATPAGNHTCDVLLVDGDHSARGSFLDISNMQGLAKPGATLLIDDIHDGPGVALRKAEARGLLNITSWNMYNRTQKENPCIRRVRPPMWHCANNWGWALGRYMHA